MTSVHHERGSGESGRNSIGLLILPAATIYLLSDSYEVMMWGSAFLCMISAVTGLLLSYWVNLPRSGHRDGAQRRLRRRISFWTPLRSGPNASSQSKAAQGSRPAADESRSVTICGWGTLFMQ
jgi:ABC 3 transport family